MLDLTYPGTSADTLEARLTVRAMRRFAAGSWGVAPWIEAGVQQAFSGLSRGVVVTDGAFSAPVSGVSPAPTSAVVGVGVSAAASDSLDLFVRYQGQFSANQQENVFSGGLRSSVLTSVRGGVSTSGGCARRPRPFRRCRSGRGCSGCRPAPPPPHCRTRRRRAGCSGSWRR